MNNKDRALRFCFNELEAAAVAGKRCPLNGTGNVRADMVGLLARLGWIKIEISGRNWRTVTILDGARAGKKTQPDPDGYTVWKVIDKNGCLINGKRWDAEAREVARLKTLESRTYRLSSNYSQRKRA